MKDDLDYWLLGDDKRAVEWRATAPAEELATALVRYRTVLQYRRLATEYESMTIESRGRRREKSDDGAL